MFYWVIPYLVAYNLTLPAADWKNGPVHTFEAEVNAKIFKDSMEMDSQSDIIMLFECRPINSSFIKCQVQNATLHNYEMKDNNKIIVETEKYDFFEEFAAIDFHIEFDRTGVKNITFPKPRGYFREMVIRTIFHNLNIGIDLTDKNFDKNYNAIDESVYGDCPTNFNIIKVLKLAEKKEFLVNRDVAVKNLMIVPFLDKFSEDQTILIEKAAKMTKCLNKKSYIFGSNEPTAMDRKEGFMRESNIIDLQSEIYLGTNRFHSLSLHTGTFKAMKNHNSKMMVGKTFEKIRLTLLSVRPDKPQ